MSIELIAQDLVDRLKTVPSFGNRVGLAIGGKDIDPFNRDLPRPAAWAVYVGDDNESEATMNPCSSLIRLNFIVKVLVDYGTEADLITTQLPLLHTTVQAIQGGEPVPGMKWVYEGQGLESLEPERSIWNQQYSILMGIS